MLLQSGPIEVRAVGAQIAPRLGGNKTTVTHLFFGAIYRCPISLHFWLVNWRIIQLSKWLITMLNNNNGLVATPWTNHLTHRVPTPFSGDPVDVTDVDFCQGWRRQARCKKHLPMRLGESKDKRSGGTLQETWFLDPRWFFHYKRGRVGFSTNL